MATTRQFFEIWEQFTLIDPEAAVDYLTWGIDADGIVNCMPSDLGCQHCLFWACSYGLIDAEVWRDTYAGFGGDTTKDGHLTLDNAARQAKYRQTEWDGSPRQR
jgi:hypothetical protein